MKIQQGPGRQYLQCDANGLDIGSYQLLKNLGLKLTGKLGGNFEVTNDTGKGRVWLKSLALRELKIKGFSIPDMDFDECWIDADLKGDRLTIKKLEMNGKELKIRCVGDMVLRERGTINLAIKLKPSERLAQEQAGILALLKNRDAEGYYQFNLGGELRSRCRGCRALTILSAHAESHLRSGRYRSEVAPGPITGTVG